MHSKQEDPSTDAAVSVAGMHSFLNFWGGARSPWRCRNTNPALADERQSNYGSDKVSLMKVARADSAVRALHFAGAVLPSNNNNFLLKLLLLLLKKITPSAATF